MAAVLGEPSEVKRVRTKPMRSQLTLEDIDLQSLAMAVIARREPRATGYVVGKTALRNQVQQILRSSLLEAEALVDTMESRGLLRFKALRRQGPRIGVWTHGK